jgi:hypothetical protein
MNTFLHFMAPDLNGRFSPYLWNWSYRKPTVLSFWSSRSRIRGFDLNEAGTTSEKRGSTSENRADISENRGRPAEKSGTTSEKTGTKLEPFARTLRFRNFSLVFNFKSDKGIREEREAQRNGKRENRKRTSLRVCEF